MHTPFDSFVQREHERYWWYRGQSPLILPPVLSTLTCDEQQLVADWYEDTERRQLVGECNIPAISVLHGFVSGSRIQSIVQLGHYSGFSTLLLGFLLQRMGAAHSLFSIDIDPEVSEYTSNWIAKAGLGHIVGIEVGDSADPAMPDRASAWLGCPPSLVFIDSSHAHEHTLRELDLWFPSIAPGGLVFLHDSSEFASRFDPGAAGGVRRALREWMEAATVEGMSLNDAFEGDRGFETMTYLDGCGLGIVQKPFDSLMAAPCIRMSARPDRLPV